MTAYPFREWGGGAKAGRKPQRRARQVDLTDEERKAKKKAYMKAYWERKRNTDGKGISAGKFKKFLVKGPISQGGNGEE